MQNPRINEWNKFDESRSNKSMHLWKILESLNVNKKIGYDSLL